MIFRWCFGPWTPAGLALVCILKSHTFVGVTPPLPAQIAIIPTMFRRKSIGRSLPEPLCWDGGMIISKLRQSIKWWHSYYSSAKGSARCPGFVGPKWLRFEQRCSPETRDGWIGECRWLFCFFLFPGLIFGATCTILWAGAVPGLPGPRGAESRPKTRGRIYRDPWSVQHTLLQSQEDDGRQVSLPLPAGRGEA